ncbi:lysophospholipase [Nocardioides sp. JQ2195]|nr:lysophospholipase [Nocardioides sp. JQ2195]
MLHGGKQHSSMSVDWRSTSWHRSHAMQKAITPRAHEHRISTTLLRYRHRGWNDVDSPSPIPDARWALDEIRDRHGDVPVVLLGHSMGARTAVHVADDPSVVGVVALAPWFEKHDSPHRLTGKHLAAAHGSHDRITSPRATAHFVRRATGVAASTELRDMGPVGHYMFKDIPAWNDFAITRALAMVEKLSRNRELN